MGNSYRPQPAAVANMASHHAWTPSYDTTNETVTITPYVLHHPTNVPKDTFYTPSHQSIHISWDNDDHHYTIRSPANPSIRPLPENRQQLRQSIRETLEASLHELHRRRYPSKSLSTPIVEKLADRYESYYQALTAPRTQLETIDGLGETRIDYLKNGVKGDQNREPNWCWLTRCPTCDEEWWSPQFNTTQYHRPIDEEPPLEPLVQKMYCPNCQHYDIPESYFSGPHPFITETLETHHEQTTENHTTETSKSPPDY